MSKKQKISTSDFLHKVVHRSKTDRLTIGELKISLHERGFGILMVIFALPVSIPIPYIPGFTTIFSVPLLFLSWQMICGYDSPWLPKWLMKKSLKRSTLAFITVKSSPILKKIEKLLHPRLTFVSSHLGTRIIGFLSLIFAISIALPLPLTNLLPGISILIMSLGLLSKDGLTILIGMLIGILGVVFTAAVLLVGKKIVMGLVNAIF